MPLERLPNMVSPRTGAGSPGGGARGENGAAVRLTGVGANGETGAAAWAAGADVSVTGASLTDALATIGGGASLALNAGGGGGAACGRETDGVLTRVRIGAVRGGGGGGNVA